MDLNTTMEELKARQTRARLVGILPFFLWVLAAGLLAARLTPLAMIAALTALALYFFWARRERTAYNDALAQANIRFGLCGELDKVEYTGRAGLTAESLDALELLPIQRNSSLLVRQGFKAESGPVTLKGWEMTFNYPDTTGSKTAYKFLSGALLTAAAGEETDPDCDLLLLRAGMLAGKTEEEFVQVRGYRTCPCPEGLGEKFHLYTRGEPGPLPAHWARRVEKLAEGVPALGALRLSPEKAAVYLGNRFYTEQVKPSFLPTQEQLKRNPLPERDGVWELFRYWASAGKTK